MGISADAIWKLAEVLNKEISVRSDISNAVVTRIEKGGKAWVRLDGATSETPVNGGTQVTIDPNDNVIVTIKNGVCTITNNRSHPNATTSDVGMVVGTVQFLSETVMDKASIQDLNAINGTIQYLEVDTAKIHNLTADQLTATVSFIDELKLNEVTAEKVTAGVGFYDELNANDVYATNITATVGFYDDLTANNVDAQKVTATTGFYDDLTANNVDATNVTSAVGYFGDLYANNITTEDIEAATGYIADLTADNVTASDIQAATAFVGDLDADNVTAADIVANKATIDSLSTNYAHITNGTIDNANISYANVNNLNAHYAGIDLANVNNAWINNGVIDTAAIVDEQVFTVTGNKATITEINADQITVRNLRATNLTVETADGYVTIGNKRTPTKEFIDSLVDDIQDKIDSTVETYTSSSVPLTTNYPANQWTTDAERLTHVGDICFVTNSASDNNGFCYRYAYDATNQTFSWVLIKDNDVTRALSDISDLLTFESETSTWIDETDEGLRTIRSNHTTLSGIVDKTVKASTQLWFTKANTTAPTAPTAQVTTNNPSTANAWNLAVPTYDATYPNYFYCWQYQYVDNTYGWSAVIRDVAMGESQERARTAITNAAAADTKAGNAQTTANANIKSSVMLWYTSNSTTPPLAPTTRVTSTATTSNTWTNVVPSYSASAPYYHYCYQQQLGNNNWQWTTPTYDDATSTAMKKAQEALPSSTFSTFQTTTFKELVDEVDEQSSTITSMSEAVQYGGRNLLPYSSPSAENLAKTSTASGTNAFVTEDGYGCYKITGVSTNGSQYASGGHYNGVILDANTTYTYSATVKVTTTESTTQVPLDFTSLGHFSVCNDNGISNDKTHEDVREKRAYAPDMVNIGEWTRISVTFTTNSIDKSSFGVYPKYSHGANYTVFIRDMKLERGPFATPWEYSQDDLTTVSNTVNSVKQTADSNSSTITNLTTTLGTNSDGTTSTNDIVHKYNRINQTLDGTIMTVGELVEQSTYGSNILEGNALNPFNWTISAPSGANFTKSAYGTSGVRITFNTVDGTECLYSPDITVENGKSYTLSVSYTVGKDYVLGAEADGYGLGVYSGSGYPGADNDIYLQRFITRAQFMNNATSTTMTSTVSFNAMSDTIVLMLNGGQMSDSQSGLSFTLDNLRLIENLSSRVTTAESSIRQNAGEIALKANASDTYTKQEANAILEVKANKDTLTSEINASADTVKINANKVNIAGAAIFTEGRLSESSLNDAYDAKGSAASVQSNLDNLQVGGKNLFLNSDVPSKWRANAPAAYCPCSIYLSENLEKGSTYTLQIWGTVSRSDKTSAVFSAFWGGGNVPLGSLTPNASKNYWTRTFVAPNNSHVDTGNMFIDVYNTPPKGASDTTYTSNVIKVKIEKGSKPTDWTPAPEDINANANNREQTIYRSAANGTATMAANTTWVTASGDTQNAWTTRRPTYNQSYPVLFVAYQRQTVAQSSGTACSCTTPVIDNTTTVIDGGNIITNTVTATKLNAASINASNMLTVGSMTNETSESILNSNIKVGGRNLLLGTRDFSGATVIPSVGADTIYGCSVGTAVVTQTTGFFDVVRWGSCVEPRPDTYYTLSFWAKANSEVEIISFFYTDAVASGYNSQGTTTSSADGSIGTRITTSWQRYWITWKTKSSVSGLKSVLPMRLFNTATVYIAGVMFEEGNTASAWSPSPDDIDASAVNRTQRIYYRSSVNTKPTTMPSTWVTETGNKYNANATTTNGWSTKVTPITSSVESTTKYLYLWTCEQREMVDGTLAYTNVLLDDSTTIIDGGNIITGTVTANKLNATNINSSGLLTVGSMTDATKSDVLNSNVVIGGRNLLPHSKVSAENFSLIAESNFDVTVVVEDGYTCYKATGNNLSFKLWNIESSPVILSANTTYTYSAWVKLTTSTSETQAGLTHYSFGHFQVTNSASTKSDKSHEDIADNRIYTPSEIQVGVWTKITITFTTNSLDRSSFTVWPKYNRGTDWQVFIRDMKLEVGNKATDWSPAPEDQSAYTDSVVGGLSISSTNLIRNGDFSNGIEYWTPNGVTISVVDDSTYGKCAKVVTTAAGSVSMRLYPNTSTNFTHVVGETYSVSFYAKADADNSIHVDRGIGYGSDTYFDNIAVTTSWNRYTATATAVSDGSLTFLLKNAGTLYLARVMLVHGDKPMDWSPDPRDVDEEFSNRMIKKVITTVSDFNDYTTTGIYYFSVSSNTNAPVTNHGKLTVNFDQGTPNQIFEPDNLSYYYKRTYNKSSSVWSAWTKVDAVGAQTTADAANNKLVAFRGTCSTAAGTAAKVVACEGFALSQGYSITVYNTTAQTVAGAITLNVNSLGAKAVWVAGAATSDTNRLYWSAGSSVTFVYDGTQFRVSDNPGSYYGTTCSVAETTAAKTTTVNDSVIFKGVAVSVPMTNTNTAASPTLNVSALGACNIYYGTSTTGPTKANGYAWPAGTEIIFIFDGKFWRCGNQTFINGGNILTGTVTADQLNANSINSSSMLTVGSFTDATLASVLNSNVTVGGRNLLKGTKKFSVGIAHGAVETEKYLGFTVVSVAGSSSTYRDVGSFTDLVLEPNTEYTLSFYAKASVELFSDSFLWPTYTESGYNSSGYTTTAADGVISSRIATSWKRYWITWKTKSNGAPTNVICARLEKNTTTGTIYVCGIMLEKGNKASDWSPSPEDIEGDAVKRTQRIYYRSNVNSTPSTPSAWVTETGNKYNTNATTMAGWSTKVTPITSSVNSETKYIYLWTCEQREMADGTIAYTNVLLDDSMTVIDGGNIATGSITANKLDVSDINTKNSLTIGALTNDTQSSVLNSNVVVGGRNLLPYSKPSSDNLALMAPNKVNVSFVTENGYGCYKATGSNTSIRLWYTQSFNAPVLRANTTYTYSAWVKVTTTTSTTSIPINFSSLGHFGVTNSASTNSDNTHEDVAAERVYSPSSIPVGKWSRISLTFKTNSLDGSFFGVYPKYNLNTDYTLFIRDMKLELGNKATDWTPAPEDVDSSISTAQTTANNAQTAAGNAQTTANNAQTAASNAQTTANTANTNATAAQTAATNAAKTATNYIIYQNATDGIKVTYNGTNAATKITANGLDVLDGAGNSVLYAGLTETGATTSKVRVGRETGTGKVTLNSDGSVDIYNNSGTNLAHFGFDYAVNTYNDYTKSPFYTLGTRKSNAAIGAYSFAEGFETTSGDWCSHAEGYKTVATGGYGGHAEGMETTASGTCDHAEGAGTVASGGSSHAEGMSTKAQGDASHAEGCITTASGEYSHSEGYETTASGKKSHAEGNYSTASGDNSHAEGYYTIANGANQHAGGIYNVSDTTSLFIVGKGTADNRRSNALKLSNTGALWIADALTQNSDRRLKTHHKYLGKDASDFMRKLKPALFTKDGERHLGFYAQDVQKAEPESWDTVTVRPDHSDESLDFDPLTLDYTALIAPLTAYVQELEKRVEYLESTVDSLVESNEKLKEMIDSI